MAARKSSYTIENRLGVMTVAVKTLFILSNTSNMPNLHATRPDFSELRTCCNNLAYTILYSMGNKFLTFLIGML
ncbi:MAG: hypothetical protein F4Y18_00725 [Cenarchaeum sp. SB0663_bin_5]|nr:hypothetical protein [Cenarchaeum sp. SB0663_bin_5]MYH04855.1 hypothetical protein [Cenarchaeum sp. SB0675_bin_21]